MKVKTVITMLFLCLFFFLTSCTRNEERVVLPDNSPSFISTSELENIDWDRKAVKFGDRNMMGNENKSGIIGSLQMNQQTNSQKWMWHLWGTSRADLTIVGFHKETQTVYPILTNRADKWTIEVAGALNGADAHIPSTVKIPLAGEWAILFYADGVYFDTLVYEIKT